MSAYNAPLKFVTDTFTFDMMVLFSTLRAEFVIRRMSPQDFCREIMDAAPFFYRRESAEAVNALCGTGYRTTREKARFHPLTLMYLVQIPERPLTRSGRVLTKDDVLRAYADGRIAFYKVSYEILGHDY